MEVFDSTKFFNLFEKLIFFIHSNAKRIRIITDNDKEKHFCIFDEIYSGTNPNDAVLCANVYLKGMKHYKYCVDFTYNK